MNVSSCGVKPVSTVCPATLAGGVAGTAMSAPGTSLRT